MLRCYVVFVSFLSAIFLRGFFPTLSSVSSLSVRRYVWSCIALFTFLCYSSPTLATTEIAAANRGGGRYLYHTHPQTFEKNVCIRFSSNIAPCGTQPVSQSSLLRLEKVREVEEFLYACVWNNEASVGRIGRSVGWSGGRRFFIARRRHKTLGRRGWKVGKFPPLSTHPI